MKFIFPKNYNFKFKLFGIIDYTTLILNIILFIIIYFILKLVIPTNLIWRFTILIIIDLPIILLSIVGFYNESFIYIAYYVLKYLFKPKIYLYKKVEYLERK